MKLQGAIFLIALFAACPGFAQRATNAPSASAAVTVEKPKFHWLAAAETRKSRENLKRVERLDPRAWTTVVGWHPGESAFATAETRSGRLCLLWIDLGSSPTTTRIKVQR